MIRLNKINKIAVFLIVLLLLSIFTNQTIYAADANTLRKEIIDFCNNKIDTATTQELQAYQNKIQEYKNLAGSLDGTMLQCQSKITSKNTQATLRKEIIDFCNSGVETATAQQLQTYQNKIQQYKNLAGSLDGTMMQCQSKITSKTTQNTLRKEIVDFCNSSIETASAQELQIYQNKIEQYKKSAGSLDGTMLQCQTKINNKMKTTSSGAQSSTTGTSTASVIDPIENPDAYKPGDNTDNSKLVDKGKIIVGTIQVIGVVVSVVALIIIGLRYMFGSVEDKANYKETMIPYIIGVVMLFTITTLLQILYNFVTGLQ